MLNYYFFSIKMPCRMDSASKILNSANFAEFYGGKIPVDDIKFQKLYFHLLVYHILLNSYEVFII